MKAVPSVQNNHIIGLLIINNLHLDAKIIMPLCLEQQICAEMLYVSAILAVILDFEKAKPMGCSHPGKMSFTHQELMKNAKK